jgi:hypothetical protein
MYIYIYVYTYILSYMYLYIFTYICVVRGEGLTTYHNGFLWEDSKRSGTDRFFSFVKLDPKKWTERNVRDEEVVETRNSRNSVF